MSRTQKIKALSLIVFGIVFVFRNYVIVIGQTPAKPVLVTLNKADSTMAIIDPTSMKVVAKVPTGDSPHEVVLSADGKTAFVANYGAQQPGSTISVIDVATAKELRRVDLAPLMRPHGLHMIGGKLYFTAETNRAIARYDPAANKVDWLMGTGQNGSHMVVGSPDQRKFYTANIGSNSVTALEWMNPANPQAWRVTHVNVVKGADPAAAESQPFGAQPEAIDLSPDGKEVWTALNEGGAISVVDTTTNKFKEKISVGGRAYRVRFTPDGKWVVNSMVESKELLIIDAATKKEIRRIKLESVPLGIAFSADGKTAFVSVVEPDAVLKIDLTSGTHLGRVETGKAPDGIAVAGM
ncbi:MAG TPA: YncE family protein [Pyrinomonadaceae bacterium]|nr:YncE family protein [Pyrinomonadaceae bacterium]